MNKNGRESPEKSFIDHFKGFLKEGFPKHLQNIQNIFKKSLDLNKKGSSNNLLIDKRSYFKIILDINLYTNFFIIVNIYLLIIDTPNGVGSSILFNCEESFIAV